MTVATTVSGSARSATILILLRSLGLWNTFRRQA